MTTLDLAAAPDRLSRAPGSHFRRLALLLVITAAFAAGFFPAATQPADGDLARLLQAMALIKLAFILPATGAVLWRMKAGVSPPFFGLYALSAAAMAASFGLIWNLTHIALGALLMHAGLVGVLVLLFTDRGVTGLLRQTLLRRLHRSA